MAHMRLSKVHRYSSSRCTYSRKIESGMKSYAKLSGSGQHCVRSCSSHNSFAFKGSTKEKPSTSRRLSQKKKPSTSRGLTSMITKLLVASLAACFAAPSNNAAANVGAEGTRPKVTWITPIPTGVTSEDTTPYAAELTSSPTGTATSVFSEETPPNEDILIFVSALEVPIAQVSLKQTETATNTHNPLVLFSGYQAYGEKASKLHSSKGSKIANDAPEPLQDDPKDSDPLSSAKPSVVIVSPRSLPTLSPSGKTQAPIESPSQMPHTHNRTNTPLMSVKTKPPSVFDARDPCGPRPKWHPNIGFTMCSNGPEYPENWATKEMAPRYFYETLSQCCRFVFAASGVCKFEDVCSRPSSSTSMPYMIDGVVR